MIASLQLILQVIWPPAAPISNDVVRDKDYRKWWMATCIVNVIPLTAALHHILCYTFTCILNPFHLDDYSLLGACSWLTRDPSLPWAIIIMIVTYVIGNKMPGVKILVAPIFLSFLPISIWIWDIPFSRRFICTNFHLENATLPLKTKFIYALGIVLYLIFIAYIIRKNRKFKPLG